MSASPIKSAAAAVLMLLATAAPAQSTAFESVVDDSPSAGAMAFDLVVVRPVSLVATLVGTGLFVVSLPFAALGRDVATPAEKLMFEPAKYTFTRPLGQME